VVRRGRCFAKRASKKIILGSHKERKNKGSKSRKERGAKGGSQRKRGIVIEYARGGSAELPDRNTFLLSRGYLGVDGKNVQPYTSS